MMNPKRKVLIAAFVLLVVFALVLILGIAPLARGISKDAQKLQTQKRTMEIFRKETQEVENFKTFSQEKHQGIESLNLLFVSPETPIPFIEFLEQYAEPLGIELTIAPGDPKKPARIATQSVAGGLAGDFWPSLEFRVSSKAAYPAAFAFLEAIEYAPFAIEILSIAMEAERESRNAAFNFVVKAYTK